MGRENKYLVLRKDGMYEYTPTILTAAQIFMSVELTREIGIPMMEMDIYLIREFGKEPVRVSLRERGGKDGEPYRMEIVRENVLDVKFVG